jgi:DNA processing protein
VLAVPGEITSLLSSGTNALLRLGATPVTAVDDVLEAVGAPRAPLAEPAALEPRLEAVRAAVADAPAAADDVVRRTGLAPGAAAAALAELELLGVVVEAEGLYREVVPRR